MTSLVFPGPTSEAVAKELLDEALAAIRDAQGNLTNPIKVISKLGGARDRKLAAIIRYPMLRVGRAPNDTPFELFYRWNKSLRCLVQLSFEWQIPCWRVDGPEFRIDEECWAALAADLPDPEFRRKFDELSEDLSHLMTMPWVFDEPAFTNLHSLLQLLHQWRDRLNELRDDPTTDHTPPPNLADAFNGLIKAMGSIGSLSIANSIERLCSIDWQIDQLVEEIFFPPIYPLPGWPSTSVRLQWIEEALEAERASLGT